MIKWNGNYKKKIMRIFNRKSKLFFWRKKEKVRCHGCDYGGKKLFLMVCVR